jgi:hypothetical protein
MNSSQYQHQQLVVPRSEGSHQVTQPRRQSQQDYRQYDYRQYQEEPPRRQSDDYYAHHDKSRRREERNPLMTVWRETYEVWDGVLEVVGKAWFKMGGK